LILLFNLCFFVGIPAATIGVIAYDEPPWLFYELSAAEQHQSIIFGWQILVGVIVVTAIIGALGCLFGELGWFLLDQNEDEGEETLEAD
jgi:hypothetical protein